MRPGTNVSTSTALPSGGPPVNTGTWFTAGVTTQGPTTPQLVTSFSQFQTIFGQRGTNGQLLSDSLETFFKEGGQQAYVARVVGPTAVTAFVQLKDAAAANSVLVDAIGPGAYANGYQIVVGGYNGNAYATTSYQVTVEDASNNVLETSNQLTSAADFAAYAKTSQYITATANGALSPAAGTFPLATGADDIVDITTTQYTNALALFTADLGPGQVSVPGVTTTAVLTAIANHCATAGVNRVGYGDMADGTNVTASTLTGASASITALGTTARTVSLWAPWFDIAPVAGSSAVRAVPPSAFAAAKCAVVDQLGNPNLPAAGQNGILSTAVAAHNTWNDTDRQTLNQAGINVIKPLYGGFRIYGCVTAVNRVSDPNYWQLNNARLDMAIIAKAKAIEERYVFSQLDGQGNDAASYGNDLKAMLLDYFNIGALFGLTPQDAFQVDTSSDVNTSATAALGNLNATIACRRSPEAELVNLNIVRVPVTQVV